MKIKYFIKNFLQNNVKKIIINNYFLNLILE